MISRQTPTVSTKAPTSADYPQASEPDKPQTFNPKTPIVGQTPTPPPPPPHKKNAWRFGSGLELIRQVLPLPTPTASALVGSHGDFRLQCFLGSSRLSGFQKFVGLGPFGVWDR